MVDINVDVPCTAVWFSTSRDEWSVVFVTWRAASSHHLLTHEITEEHWAQICFHLPPTQTCTNTNTHYSRTGQETHTRSRRWWREYNHLQLHVTRMLNWRRWLISRVRAAFHSFFSHECRWTFHRFTPLNGHFTLNLWPGWIWMGHINTPTLNVNQWHHVRCSKKHYGAFQGHFLLNCAVFPSLTVTVNMKCAQWCSV